MLTAYTQAKQVNVLGLFVSSEETHPPGLPETSTVTITCAVVSTAVCYTATIPDDSKIDPRDVDDELAPEDQYTSIKTATEIFNGRVTSHYQHNGMSETGELLRVHVLTIVR